MSNRRSMWLASAVLLAGLSLVSAARAQSGTEGCNAGVSGAQQMWICPGGLTIIEENGARFSLDDRNGDGNVDLIRLWRKAVLLEFTAGRRLEVVTPQAIAAVRGTRWVVDARSGETEVFVVRGAVGVRRPSGGSEVVLDAGDGVDAAGSTGPLEAKRWAASRVAALMARLGQ